MMTEWPVSNAVLTYPNLHWYKSGTGSTRRNLALNRDKGVAPAPRAGHSLQRTFRTRKVIVNLHKLLVDRETDGQPIRVGLIGAGRYGTMYLAQANNIPGIHVVAIADINVTRAEGAFALVGWPKDQIAPDIATALANRTTAIIANADELFEHDIDVIVEATGNPIIGIKHALRAIETGKHIIMVTVEADALAGPALAKRAEAAGVVYSMAYGDQPALIMELVDWARTSGFDVVCAGKGAKFLEHYHEMNPDNVWDNWEFSKELTDSGQLNPYMHTSFRDGTKAAIEMAAVANAAGLIPSDNGLTFAPGDVEQIATIQRPSSIGGVLDHEGTVDVMSSVMRDGTLIPHNTQEGMYVVIKATNDYVANCFNDYPWHPDSTKQYAALYRPYHYVGLELNISIANAALRGIATGYPIGFYGDVVATAKKDLQAGEFLDGEGGFTVYGKLVSAKLSVATGALPVALAHHVELVNDIAKGATVSWSDVIMDDSLAQALELRRETEALLALDKAAV
jgi:predicted homoserine dehydrogenase-like protein